MELVELGRLSGAQQAELEGDEPHPWGLTGEGLEWRPKDHHVGLRDADGALVAVAGWLITEVEAQGRRIPVVGIGGVIVAARCRGQGLGRRVIAEVIARAQRLGPEIALLFCAPARVSLYERRGFVRVSDPVVVGQAGGRLKIPMETMWRPLREAAALPAGPLNIAGLPF